MVIPFVHLYQEKRITEAELRDIAGLKIQHNRCAGTDGCVRDGDHQGHSWDESIVLVEGFKRPIRGSKIGEEETVSVAKRWSNIHVAYCEVLLKHKPSELAAIWYSRDRKKTDADLVKEAFKFARGNFFIGDEPVDLRVRYKVESYEKLMNRINDTYREIVNRAHFASEKQAERENATRAVAQEVYKYGGKM